MSTAIRTVTADELFRMPDDGYRYELVAGELRKMSPAGSIHGIIIGNLFVPLGDHIRRNGLGPIFGSETGFRLSTDPDTVRAPDIAFVRSDRIPADGIPAAFWPGPPDLAVEVLSPGDTVNEVDEKVQAWLTAGAAMVWVVNPKRKTVTVYRSASDIVMLTEKDTLSGLDVVPGFEHPVAEIFAGIKTQ